MDLDVHRQRVAEFGPPQNHRVLIPTTSHTAPTRSALSLGAGENRDGPRLSHLCETPADLHSADSARVSARNTALRPNATLNPYLAQAALHPSIAFRAVASNTRVVGPRTDQHRLRAGTRHGVAATAAQCDRGRRDHPVSQRQTHSRRHHANA